MFAPLVGVDISLNIPKFFQRRYTYHIIHTHECIDTLKIYELLRLVSPLRSRKNPFDLHSIEIQINY